MTTHDILEKAKKAARSKGGLCLSKSLKNSKSKLTFQCDKGHRWDTTPHSVINGTWCKICGFESARHKRSDSIQTFISIAKDRGGKCTSKEYFNQTTELNFVCSKGHSFNMRASVIKRGAWCTTCQKEQNLERIKNKYSQKVIADLKRRCEQKNGKIISGNYINNRSKFIFECNQRHQWETYPYLIIKGHWCKVCAAKTVTENQKDDLQTFIDIAISKGGKCLSTKYISAQHKLLFECSEGHQWLGRPQGVKRGNWCRKCYGTAKSDIQEMINIATERGGKCLSIEYISDAINLTWQCCEGHIWEASPNNIKHDKWCPTCAEGIGERICRLFFQKLFKVEFIKVRPDWLRNSTGFPLELDGYAPELNLAFEHQGQQHYREVSFFKNKKNYDREKRKLCKQRGVTLIEIPEIPKDTKIKDLKPYIIKECNEKGILLPDDVNEIEISPFEIFTFTKNEERRLLAKKAEEKINSKGGVLIETHLSDKGISFKVVCSNGHHWNISKANLFLDKWCPYCKRTPSINGAYAKEKPTHQKASDKKTASVIKVLQNEPSRQLIALERVLQIANEKGGICISEKYVDNATKLHWQCSEGHEWWANPSGIRSGKWCPKCAGNSKGSIEEIIHIVEQRGGKCLSKTYSNNYSKIRIECENNHRFTTIAKSVKRGSWCPKCAIEKRASSKRKNIDDMNILANRRNGKCLSTAYVNNTTKLLWQCENEHQFLSTPGNVYTGYWCPKCANKKLSDKAAIERQKKIKQILQTKKGKAFSISDSYNRNSLVTWQCNNGHIWSSRIGNILDGHWCPSCSNKENWNGRKTSIQEIKKFAQSKGGDCLSKEYVDSLTKLKFICDKGHSWTALWSNIKSKDSWCPQCASKLRWDKRRKSNIS